MNTISVECPECGHNAVCCRKERHHRGHHTVHFACTNLDCGARFASTLTFSHITRVSRSRVQASAVHQMHYVPAVGF